MPVAWGGSLPKSKGESPMTLRGPPGRPGAGVGSLSERTDPCVPPECPNPPCTPGGQFSSMALWLAMQGANVAPWVEIGVIKHDDGNNTGPLVWYGYCGKC